MLGLPAALAVGAAGMGVLAFVDDTILTHDLLDADFTVNAEPFETGVAEDYEFRLADGAYEITATTPNPVAGATSVGELARVAHVVDVTAEVARIDDETRAARVGVGVLTVDEEEYVFAADARSWFLLRYDDDDGGGASVLAEVPVDDAFWPPEDIDMTLRVTGSIEQAIGTGGDVELRGSIDGRQVIQVTDQDGFENFAYATLHWYDRADGATVRYDDVVAVVPE